MEITIPHNLNIFAATDKIQNLLTNLKNDYVGQISEVKETWLGAHCVFSFKYTPMAAKFEGEIMVHKDKVIISGKLPGMIKIFEPVIEKTIRKKAEELLK